MSHALSTSYVIVAGANDEMRECWCEGESRRRKKGKGGRAAVVATATAAGGERDLEEFLLLGVIGFAANEDD